MKALRLTDVVFLSVLLAVTAGGGGGAGVCVFAENDKLTLEGSVVLHRDDVEALSSGPPTLLDEGALGIGRGREFGVGVVVTVVTTCWGWRRGLVGNVGSSVEDVPGRLQPCSLPATSELRRSRSIRGGNFSVSFAASKQPSISRNK